MGDGFQHVVDLEATLQEASELADRAIRHLIASRIVVAELSDCTLGKEGHSPDVNAHDVMTIPAGTDWFLTQRTNGVAVVKERTVFYSPGSHLICPSCGKDFGTQSLAFSSDAIKRWYTENAKPEARCHSCHSIGNLNEWFDPPWAFGNLGLTFWNWWPLKTEFVETIKLLWKHRVAVVSGKI